MNSRKQAQDRPFKVVDSDVQIKVVGEAPNYRDKNESVAKFVCPELQGLCQIVGDPTSSESSWLNACVAAGDKSLLPQSSIAASLWRRLGTTTAGTFALLTVTLNFIMAIFLASQFTSFFHGIENNSSLDTLGHGDGLGVLLAVCANIALVAGLSIKSKQGRWLTWPSMAFLVLVAVSIGSTMAGPVVGVLCAVFSMLSMSAIGWLGALCREHLPRTFDAGKLMRSKIGALAIPAVFMAVIIWIACTTPRIPGPYSEASSGALCLLLGLLSLAVTAPGLAIARASKSTSKAACVLMAVLVQLPLVSGLLASALIASFATLGATFGLGVLQPFFANASSLDPLWQTAGSLKVAYLLAVGVLTVALAAGSGLLGAAANRLKS